MAQNSTPPQRGRKGGGAAPNANLSPNHSPLPGNSTPKTPKIVKKFVDAGGTVCEIDTAHGKQQHTTNE